MGIYLDRHAVSGAGAQHLFHIDVVARSPLKLPSRHVAEDGGMRVRDCTEQTVGLRYPVKFEATVDAGHEEVEPIEHFVRVVEGTVGQDVRLDAFKIRKSLPDFLFIRSASWC